MMIIKTAKVIRNNWKKSVLFSCVAIWGSNYVNNKIKEHSIMRSYCEEALRFGNASQKATHNCRHITVLLNPIANNKKGKNLYEKYVAPLFHLAGLRVSLVVTESEGQAKDLMLIMDNTDAVVIAGGNGSLHEAITGLLRRPDEHMAVHRFPIGIIPIGKRNTISYSLNKFDKNNLTEAQILAESAMSVIRETSKRVDVMKVEGSRGHPVFALEGLHFGAIRDTMIDVDKYWYFGRTAKPYLAFFSNSFKNYPSIDSINLSFTEPCNGCSKCYRRYEASKTEEKTTAGNRWWHIFLSRKSNTAYSDTADKKSEINLRNIINEKCGQWSHLNLNAFNFYVQNTNECKLQITIHSSPLTQNQFIKDGVKLFNCKPLPETTSREETGTIKIIDANDINIKLTNETSDDKVTDSISNAWFSIDTESYESQNVNITLMPKKLNIYAL